MAAWASGSPSTSALRYDFQHSYVPEQTRPEGPFAAAATFPRVEVGKWGRFAPRVAVAWDMTGSGQDGDQDNLRKVQYRGGDLRRTTTSTRRIKTSTDGPIPIATAATIQVRSISAPTAATSTTSARRAPPTTRSTRTCRLSHVSEVTASMEHELAPNVAVRGLYVLKHIGSDYNTINVLRPYSAFNIPITRRDPGPDGVLSTGDDGEIFTIYDYDPAFRGSNFVGNQEVNRPDGRSDYYNWYEASITRRMSRSWSMLAAYTATKYHRWIVGIPQSPNDEFFRLDDQWRWAFKFNGNYNFPTHFPRRQSSRSATACSASARTCSARPTQRPAACVSSPQRPSDGAVWLAARRQADDVQRTRLEGVALPKGRLNASFDVLNVLNTNAITAVTYVSGPSFGRVTDILPPRTIALRRDLRLLEGCRR